jgi:hypothetical protein
MKYLKIALIIVVLSRISYSTFLNTKKFKNIKSSDLIESKFNRYDNSYR